MMIIDNVKKRLKDSEGEIAAKDQLGMQQFFKAEKDLQSSLLLVT